MNTAAASITSTGAAAGLTDRLHAPRSRLDSFAMFADTLDTAATLDDLDQLDTLDFLDTLTHPADAFGPAFAPVVAELAAGTRDCYRLQA